MEVSLREFTAWVEWFAVVVCGVLITVPAGVKLRGLRDIPGRCRPAAGRSRRLGGAARPSAVAATEADLADTACVRRGPDRSQYLTA